MAGLASGLLMADSVACLIIAMVIVVAGLVASLLILVPILKETLQGRTMSTIERLFLALSCSHIGYSIVMAIEILQKLLGFTLGIYAEYLISALLLCFMYFGTSLTLCMCFFYYFKIIPFGSRFLSLVKMKIDVLIPWMIVVVKVASLCISLPFVMLQIGIRGSSTSNGSVSPFSAAIGSATKQRISQIFLGSLGLFLLAVILNALTVISLTRHVRRMTSCSGNAHAKAQRAIKFLVTLLIFYVIFLSLLIILMFSGLQRFMFGKCILLIAQCGFVPIQCGLLIHGNPKYKEACRLMCPCRKMLVF